MTGRHVPAVLALTPGAPLDPGTWSGSSRHLCLALARRGALAGAADGRWAPIDWFEKAATYSRNADVWRQRHSALDSPFFGTARAITSWIGSHRLRRINPRPDALLQIGARHDLSSSSRLGPVLRCSYHDSNMALTLRRPDLTAHLRPRAVRSALDFERRLYDGLDLIFVMSEWLRRSLIEDFEQEPDKVIVVGAGANLDAIPEAPERDFAHPRLLFIGKHFARKGGPQLLEAFRLIREERPDAELVLVGQSSPPTEEPGVRCLGRIGRAGGDGDAQIEAVYRQATAFVMPSLFEPFGIVFLEAMAHRLPCIGGASCAMPEIIREGVTGHVVPPADVGLLAQRLLALIDDPERARSMGEAGYDRFLARYTWDRVAERMLSAIEGRLNGVDPVAPPNARAGDPAVHGRSRAAPR